MATVEKRGKKWTVRYQARDSLGNVTGQKRVSGFKTKEDAMAAARDLERATAAGVDVHGDARTCGELMELWFQTKVGHIEDTTLARYSFDMDVLQSHPVYGTRIQQLRASSLESIINDLVEARGISSSTASDYTAPLRMAMRWGLSQGMIPVNPLAGTSKPKAAKREQKILSEEDIHALIRECRDQNPAFLIPLYLVIYGGLRREECAGLRWQDVDFPRRTILIRSAETITISGKRIKKDPKSGCSRRAVTFPEFVMDELRVAMAKRPKGEDHVCLSSRRAPYGLSSYSHAVLDLVDRINARRDPMHQMPRVSFHDLRHTHAAMLIRLGIQPKVISERLGHASIKITMDLYGYLMPGLQEAVADALEVFA